MTSKLTGKLIHSHQYFSSKPMQNFWNLQANIVKQLRMTRALLMVVTFVHPDHNSWAVSTGFIQQLVLDGWLTTDTNIHTMTMAVLLLASDDLLLPFIQTWGCLAMPLTFECLHQSLLGLLPNLFGLLSIGQSTQFPRQKRKHCLTFMLWMIMACCHFAPVLPAAASKHH